LRGRVREGGSFARCGHDHLKNSVSIFQNIGIPETKHAIAFGFEPAIPLDVFDGLGVLAAVDLHNQLVVLASEINDETSNGGLTPET
jgi:hypothetical protein